MQNTQFGQIEMFTENYHRKGITYEVVFKLNQVNLLCQARHNWQNFLTLKNQNFGKPTKKYIN
jgi:hypothetical protein